MGKLNPKSSILYRGLSKTAKNTTIGSKLNEMGPNEVGQKSGCTAKVSYTVHFGHTFHWSNDFQTATFFFFLMKKLEKTLKQ